MIASRLAFIGHNKDFKVYVSEETKHVYATTHNMFIMCNIIQYVGFLLCRIHEIYVQTVGTHVSVLRIYACMYHPGFIFYFIVNTREVAKQ